MPDSPTSALYFPCGVSVLGGGANKNVLKVDIITRAQGQSEILFSLWHEGSLVL